MIIELIFILFIIVIILASFLPGRKSVMNKKRDYEDDTSPYEDLNIPKLSDIVSANTRAKKSVRFSNERNERLYNVRTGETLKDLVGKT